MTFEQELEELLNKYNKDSESNTPDFILARFIKTALRSFTVAVNQRDLYNNFNTIPETLPELILDEAEQ